MRRLVDRWWLVAPVLLVAVIVLTYALFVGEVHQHHQEQRVAASSGERPEPVGG